MHKMKKQELLKQICDLIDVEYNQFNEEKTLEEIRNKTLLNLLDGVGADEKYVKTLDWANVYLKSIDREIE